jgi:hypothetical protein
MATTLHMVSEFREDFHKTLAACVPVPEEQGEEEYEKIERQRF